MGNLATTIRNLAVAVLILLVTLGGYFFIHIKDQERLLTEHHLRLLASSGQYISDAIDGIVTNVRNSAGVSDADLELPEGGTAKKRKDLILGAIDKKRRLINGLDALDTGTLADGSLKALIDSIESKLPAKKKTTSLRMHVALDPDASVPQIVFLFHRYRTIAWRKKIEDLLGPALPEELFSDVLIIRKSGSVLLEKGSSHLHIQRLEVPPPEKSEKGAADRSQSAPTSWSPASLVREVSIAGDSYKLFVQPIRLPLPIEASSDSGGWVRDDYWLLVGLIPTSRFRALTMAISPSFVLIAVGLILFSLLLLPVLKVRFMGAREALRYKDLALLALAIVTGSSLYTFGVLVCTTWSRDAEEVEQQLQTTARYLISGFRIEAQVLDNTLHQVKDIQLSPDSIRTGLLSNSSGLPGVDPFTDMVVWIDGTGMQIGKWTAKSTTTPRVSVASREYYSESKRGLTLGEPKLREFAGGRYLQSIRTLTTGQEVLDLSRWLPPKINQPDVLVAMEGRPRSVIGPVLPPGVGFAVIDASGLVLFHSERVRNVRERFYFELSSDRAVRLAVEQRKPVLTRTTYRAAPCVLCVMPIDGTPWSLVTFEDAGITRGRLVEILAVALTLYLLYGVILILTAFCVFWWFPSDPLPGAPRRLWYWPTAEKLSAYRQLAFVFAILFTAWTIVLGWANSLWILRCAAFTPPLALILFRLRVQHGMPRNHAQDPVRPPRPALEAFSICCGLLALVLGVVPAMGLYHVAFHETRETCLMGDEVAFYRAVNQRRLERLRWYDDVELSSGARATIEQSLLGSSDEFPIGLYAPSDWRWWWSDSLDSPARVTNRNRGLQVMPVLNTLLARMGLFDAKSELEDADEKRIWQCDKNGITFEVVDAVQPGQPGSMQPPGNRLVEPRKAFHVVAQPAPLDMLWSPWFQYLAVLGLIGLGLVVWRGVNDCFLGTFNSVRAVPPPLRLQGIRRGLLLRCRVEDWDPELRSHSRCIGAHELRTEDLVRSDSTLKNAAIVVLRDFDHGLREPEVIARKIEMLEYLNSLPNARVFVESAVEPLYFLTARYQDHYPAPTGLGIALERWAAALEGYVRIRQPSREEPRIDRLKTMKDMLGRECAPLDPALTTHIKAGIEKAIEDNGPIDADDIVETVLDEAKAWYRKIWTSCSSEEKVLLYRIAREGLVSRDARSGLMPLCRRGLVFVHPVRLMNESFRKFVLTAERAEVFAKWQQRGEVSAWAKLRAPMLFSLGALAVFFFATQRETLTRTLGLMTALTAVVPGAINMLSSLNLAARGGGAKADSSAVKTDVTLNDD